ncbi:hypothetical protein O3M35_000705 [Rhynocoris fuscipes]|uniref:Secreted protein n=1 Tax=Rhynocoris fuscipes TaxID=488301 RepID=A0AAW1DNA6_9HEMI
MIWNNATNYLMMITKLKISNIIQITILLFITQNITLINADNPILQKLLKIKQAKQLRNDLHIHKDFIDKMINNLDEWSINEINEITNNKDLDLEKVQFLKNELIQTKNNVNKLSEDVSNVEDSEDMHGIKLKYNDLYIYIENIGDYFNNNNKRNAFRLLKEYFGDSFPNFNEQYNSLTYQIQTLYKQIVIRENILLSNECIKAIRENEFDRAAIKYNSIKDDSTLTNVVKEVYNSSENNFDLIINFASKVSNVSQTFILYSTLIYEMEINKQNQNPYRIVDLINNIKTEIIYQIKLNIKIKKDALSLEEFLINKLKLLGRENLKKTILDEKYLINIPLFEKILLLDENIFTDITYIVLLEFYNDSTVKPLFGWIIEAFTKILDEIFKNHLISNDVFKLAYYLNSLLEKSKQPSELSIDVRMVEDSNLYTILSERLDYLKRKLPESVRNIVFMDNVCIINVGLNEFLYSSNNNTISVNKFSVFTSVNNNIKDERIWKINRSYNNLYNIQNYLQNLSYLYTSDIDENENNDSNGHIVYTWIQTLDILGIWQIEPVGDDCLIKNVLHNEYLYVSEESSHIVSIKNIVNNNSDNFKWRFIKCPSH